MTKHRNMKTVKILSMIVIVALTIIACKKETNVISTNLPATITLTNVKWIQTSDWVEGSGNVDAY